MANFAADDSIKTNRASSYIYKINPRGLTQPELQTESENLLESGKPDDVMLGNFFGSFADNALFEMADLQKDSRLAPSEVHTLSNAHTADGQLTGRDFASAFNPVAPSEVTSSDKPALEPVATTPAPVATPEPVATTPAPVATPEPVATTPAPVATPEPVATTPGATQEPAMSETPAPAPAPAKTPGATQEPAMSETPAPGTPATPPAPVATPEPVATTPGATQEPAMSETPAPATTPGAAQEPATPATPEAATPATPGAAAKDPAMAPAEGQPKSLLEGVMGLMQSLLGFVQNPGKESMGGLLKAFLGMLTLVLSDQGEASAKEPAKPAGEAAPTKMDETGKMPEEKADAPKTGTMPMEEAPMNGMQPAPMNGIQPAQQPATAGHGSNM